VATTRWLLALAWLCGLAGAGSAEAQTVVTAHFDPTAHSQNASWNNASLWSCGVVPNNTAQTGYDVIYSAAYSDGLYHMLWVYDLSPTVRSILIDQPKNELMVAEGATLTATAGLTVNRGEAWVPYFSATNTTTTGHFIGPITVGTSGILGVAQVLSTGAASTGTFNGNITSYGELDAGGIMNVVGNVDNYGDVLVGDLDYPGQLSITGTLTNRETRLVAGDGPLNVTGNIINYGRIWQPARWAENNREIRMNLSCTGTFSNEAGAELGNWATSDKPITLSAGTFVNKAGATCKIGYNTINANTFSNCGSALLKGTTTLTANAFTQDGSLSMSYYGASLSVHADTFTNASSDWAFYDPGASPYGRNSLNISCAAFVNTATFDVPDYVTFSLTMGNLVNSSSMRLRGGASVTSSLRNEAGASLNVNGQAISAAVTNLGTITGGGSYSGAVVNNGRMEGGISFSGGLSGTGVLASDSLTFGNWDGVVKAYSVAAHEGTPSVWAYPGSRIAFSQDLTVPGGDFPVRLLSNTTLSAPRILIPSGTGIMTFGEDLSAPTKLEGDVILNGTIQVSDFHPDLALAHGTLSGSGTISLWNYERRSVLRLESVTNRLNLTTQVDKHGYGAELVLHNVTNEGTIDTASYGPVKIDGGTFENRGTFRGSLGQGKNAPDAPVLGFVAYCECVADYDEVHQGNERLVQFVLQNNSADDPSNFVYKVVIPLGTAQGVFDATAYSDWTAEIGENETTLVSLNQWSDIGPFGACHKSQEGFDLYTADVSTPLSPRPSYGVTRDNGRTNYIPIMLPGPPRLLRGCGNVAIPESRGLNVVVASGSTMEIAADGSSGSVTGAPMGAAGGQIHITGGSFEIGYIPATNPELNLVVDGGSLRMGNFLWEPMNSVLEVRSGTATLGSALIQDRAAIRLGQGAKCILTGDAWLAIEHTANSDLSHGTIEFKDGGHLVPTWDVADGPEIPGLTAGTPGNLVFDGGKQHALVNATEAQALLGFPVGVYTYGLRIENGATLDLGGSTIYYVPVGMAVNGVAGVGFTNLGSYTNGSILPLLLRASWVGSADGRWERASNWSEGEVPGAWHAANFVGTPTLQPSLGQDESVAHLHFRTPGWVLGGGGGRLTVGSGGIESEGSGRNEIGAPVLLGADSTWRVGDGNALVLTGGVDGNGSSLTKDGLGTLEMRGSDVTYAGPTRVCEGRLLLTDTTGFTSDITNNAAVEFGVTGGTWVFAQSLLGAGHFTKSGDGKLIMNGLQDYGVGAVFDVLDGTVILNTDAGAAAVLNLAVIATSASTANLCATQHLAALALAGGAKANLVAGHNRALVTKALGIEEVAGSPTSRLDLTDNALIVDYDDPAASPLQDIRRWIASGCDGRLWDGNGIVSTSAAGNSAAVGLGYAQNDLLLPKDRYSIFAGQAVDLTTILVKYTYLGDMNLDGKVDDNDVTILVLNYDRGRVSTHTWPEGDVAAYDGKIDDNDVTVLVLNYGSGWKAGMGGPLGGISAAVPEPATLALLALGGTLALLRRRSASS